jgi:general secretion pathway protein I
MRSPRGFTLLEVMVALAILGLALTVLVKGVAGNISGVEDARLTGVATDLARAKMYDIEEKEIKEGFTDIEMPSWDDLTAMAQGKAKLAGSGAGSGSAFGSGFGSAFGSGFGSADPLQSFQNSALGGMLSMFGGQGANGKSMDILGAQGGSLIQSQYAMFQQILKVTVVKVTLDLKWKVLGRDRDLRVVEFLTDAASMDKVLNGLGAQDLATGSGTSTGSGSGGKTPTPTKGPVTK